MKHVDFYKRFWLLLIGGALLAQFAVAQSQSPIPVIQIDGSNDYIVTAGTTVLIDGSGSHDPPPDSGPIVKHDWYLNNAGSWTFRGDSVYYAFLEAEGSPQSLKLVIKDDDNQYASLTISVTVLSASPTVEREYYVRDHLGSIRATVNQDGELINATDHYPYGLVMPNRSIVSGEPVNKNYTGHEYDSETELLYAGARSYDPVIAKWTAVDPLAALFPGQSPYMYVSGNPISRTDPTGKADCKDEKSENGEGGGETKSDGAKDSGAEEDCEEEEPDIIYMEEVVVEANRRGGFLGWLSRSGSAIIDGVQVGLDLAGFIPGVGIAADLINAGISVVRAGVAAIQGDSQAARGFMTDAALSSVAAVPIIGDGVAAVKMAGVGIAVTKTRRLSRAAKAAEASRTGNMISFTKSNIRQNLAAKTGKVVADADAHHVIPQQFRKEINRLAPDINIDDPRYLSWWQSKAHKAAAKAYNAEWIKFLAGNPNSNEILGFARDVMNDFGMGSTLNF
jgi:RHS repeat-associated protein